MVFEVVFDAPDSLKRERDLTPEEMDAWWLDSPRLGSDALVCLLDPSDGGDLIFCNVVQRPKNPQIERKGAWPRNECAVTQESRNRFRIRLSTTSTDDHATLFVFKNFPRLENSHFYTLVEFPGVLLPGFEPVLKALQLKQKSGDLPLAELLMPPTQAIELTETGLPAYARRTGFRFDMSAALNGHTCLWDPQQPFDQRLFKAHSTLDAAQSLAITSALTNQLALIQGPPGTGKSYCGVELIRILLATKRRKTSLGPILVVCYTNHALDQLLEHLVDADVKQIIRIGGRSQSEVLAPINLKQVVRNQGVRTKGEHSDIRGSRKGLEELQKELGQTAAQIASTSGWDAVKAQAEAVIPGLTNLIEAVADGEGFIRVSKHKSTPQQRFNQWLRGGGREISNTRLALFRTWVGQLKAPLLEKYADLLEDFTSAQHAIDAVRMEEQLRCLQQADVVGVTSSGLARHIEMLQNLRSKVIVIEEAGELLEPHTITSLLPSIEHAILIGDHLQLRPQIMNFDLSRESSQGAQYSLDVSLFERLASPATGLRAMRLPFSTLRTQRRMHPSISALIRDELYPALEDFDFVNNYPEVTGIKKRLYWLDHNMAEAGADEEHSTSHWNAHEVEMTVALVSHLIKQGAYSSRESIAVLTPYLGQLQRLRTRMNEQFEIVVSDRDENDLAQHGFTETEETPEIGPIPRKTSMLQAVRLATVDNFQGEEADVVVVSLVRSNAQRKVGFLKTSNRINVLLSRAKHGMYILGNAETAKSVPFWAHVIRSLEMNGRLGPSLELVCPRHTDTPIAVQNPSDFAMLSPEGGCQLRCGQRMDCGHVCIRSCHSAPLHAAVECLEPCRRMLTCGHPCLKQCYLVCEQDCKVKIDMAADFLLPCGHHVDKLECRYVQDPSAYLCNVKMQRTVPGCDHALELPCHIDVNSKDFRCRAICGEVLACGNICKRTCSVCRGKYKPVDHGQCKTLCGREYTSCTHSCRQACHGAEPCKPCEAKCETHCEHSNCPLACNKPCVPCLQSTCNIGCEHSNCNMPCAVPCSHLPCSKRCTEELACGHQCPTLCSEPCPDKRFCAVCADDRVKNVVVDYIVNETYVETDLDQDPIIIPRCGHLITMINLDGLMEMNAHYTFNMEGVIIGIAENDKPFSSKEIKACPTCRGSLVGISRYARLTRRATLDASTKKFVSWANAQLHPLLKHYIAESDQLIKSVGSVTFGTKPAESIAPYFQRPLNITGSLTEQATALRRVEAKRHANILAVCRKVAMYRDRVKATEQPFRRVQGLVEHLRAQGSDLNSFQYDNTVIVTNFEVKASMLLLRCTLAVLQDILSLRRRAPTELLMDCTIDLSRSLMECQKAIAAATEAKLPREMTEGHILMATLYGTRNTLEDVTDKEEAKDAAIRHLEEADALMKSYPMQTASLQDEVLQVCRLVNERVFYQTVTSDEMMQVYEAMAAEFQGSTGHWYRCENGHPFTVGECGRPMEQARCPECGSGVGGVNHTALAGVQRDQAFDERMRDLRI